MPHGTTTQAQDTHASTPLCELAPAAHVPLHAPILTGRLLSCAVCCVRMCYQMIRETFKLVDIPILVQEYLTGNDINFAILGNPGLTGRPQDDEIELDISEEDYSGTRSHAAPDRPPSSCCLFLPALC
jgi:hypothetical protein